MFLSSLIYPKIINVAVFHQAYIETIPTSPVGLDSAWSGGSFYTSDSSDDSAAFSEEFLYTLALAFGDLSVALGHVELPSLDCPRPGITFMHGNLPWGCFGPNPAGGYYPISGFTMFITLVWIRYFPGFMTG